VADIFKKTARVCFTSRWIWCLVHPTNIVGYNSVCPLYCCSCILDLIWDFPAMCVTVKAVVAALFLFGQSGVPVSILTPPSSCEVLRRLTDIYHQTIFIGSTNLSPRYFNSHLPLYPSQSASTLPVHQQLFTFVWSKWRCNNGA
jgi:hypothetical protein